MSTYTFESRNLRLHTHSGQSTVAKRGNNVRQQLFGVWYFAAVSRHLVCFVYIAGLFSYLELYAVKLQLLL